MAGLGVRAQAGHGPAWCKLGGMTEPAAVEERVIWTDDEGRVVDEKDATGGEVIETFPDGRVKSTLFQLSDQEPFSQR
jgi:hypothetical protein